jgi:hypothetical protein
MPWLAAPGWCWWHAGLFLLADRTGRRIEDMQMEKRSGR